MARLYTSGERVKQDPRFKKDLAESYKWTLRAANQGDLFSAEKMIKIFRDGKGVKRDMEEAMFWCRVYLSHVPLRFYKGHNGANIGSTCRWTVENHLTKPQIEKAKVRAAQWKYRPIDEDLKQKLIEEEKIQREEEALMKPKDKKD